MSGLAPGGAAAEHSCHSSRSVQNTLPLPTSCAGLSWLDENCSGVGLCGLAFLPLWAYIGHWENGQERPERMSEVISGEAQRKACAKYSGAGLPSHTAVA